MDDSWWWGKEGATLDLHTALTVSRLMIYDKSPKHLAMVLMYEV